MSFWFMEGDGRFDLSFADDVTKSHRVNKWCMKILEATF